MVPQATPTMDRQPCVYILASLHWYTWIVFTGWILVFLAFYLTYGRKHSVLGRQRREEADLEDPTPNEGPKA